MTLDTISGRSLRPKPFRDGLQYWRNSLSASGATLYDNISAASVVTNDNQFEGFLSLQKTSATQSLIHTQKTYFSAGQYIEVSFRIWHEAGSAIDARIVGAGYNKSNVIQSGVETSGPSVTVNTIGETFVSAIIGTGNRTGVDMRWLQDIEYGYFGLELSGVSGGTYLIADMQIRDVTGLFLSQIVDWVDVRDFGAIGDGNYDNAQAFMEADAAADGRELLIPDGIFHLAEHVTLHSRCRFVGRVTMPDERRLQLTHNYNYDSYLDAFKDEERALEKAIQALYHYTDHDSLDLCGRQIHLTRSIDVRAAVNDISSYSNRRAIRNGQLVAETSENWNSDIVTSAASYNANGDNTLLTNVTNAAQIAVGAHVTGTGVGRGIFVTQVDASAKTVRLNQQLTNPAATQTYSFERYKFMLDFAAFEVISRVEFDHVEFQCNDRASGVMLGYEGISWVFTGCWFMDVKNRGICSYHLGCNGLTVETCQFKAGDDQLPANERKTVAITTHKNDMKIRNNRAVKFKHFAVLGGGGHIISGNHFFQGGGGSSARSAGLVFMYKNSKSLVTGNYIDNCWVEVSNEQDNETDAGWNSKFGHISLTNNIFVCSDHEHWFNWLVLAPHGDGYFLEGIVVTGNLFTNLSDGVIDRVDGIDESEGSIDPTKTRDVFFYENSYFGNIGTKTLSPKTHLHDQTTAVKTWKVNYGDFLPFKCQALAVESMVPVSDLSDSSNARVTALPTALRAMGADKREVHLDFPTATKGKIALTVSANLPN